MTDEHQSGEETIAKAVFGENTVVSTEQEQETAPAEEAAPEESGEQAEAPAEEAAPEQAE